MASVGIYAVVAQVTARRTREIGIRMAPGATASGVERLVLSRGLAQLLVGLLLGLGGAVGTIKLLASTGLLYRASSSDPIVLAGISVVLVSVGGFACWLPARRAANVNPMVALKCE
jgi:ABC-type antimicrobial peptide transport system permease subunit